MKKKEISILGSFGALVFIVIFIILIFFMIYDFNGEIYHYLIFTFTLLLFFYFILRREYFYFTLSEGGCTFKTLFGKKSVLQYKDISKVRLNSARGGFVLIIFDNNGKKHAIYSEDSYNIKKVGNVIKEKGIEVIINIK